MKIQIKSIYGKDLFEQEGSALKQSVEQAIKAGVNLRGAYLRKSNLSGADLSGADLRKANLRYADLRGAYLRETEMPMYCKWGHAIIDGKIKIGCETKTPEEWKDWLASGEEFETRRGTDDFRQIEAVIRAYIAYQEVLTKNKTQ